MARTNSLTNFLTDVAIAIKTKKGSQTDILASDFDTEILALPSQGTYQQKSITVYDNGSQTITPDIGYDAIDELTIVTQVSEKILQTKTYNFTHDVNIELEPDTGYDGFDKINLIVNVSDAEAVAPYSDNIKTNKSIFGVRGTYTSDELATKLVDNLDSSHVSSLQPGVDNVGDLPFNVTVTALPIFTAQEIVATIGNSNDNNHVLYLVMQDDVISFMYANMNTDLMLIIYLTTDATVIAELEEEGFTVGEWYTFEDETPILCTESQFNLIKLEVLNFMSDLDTFSFDADPSVADLTALLQYSRDKLNLKFSDAIDVSL